MRNMDEMLPQPLVLGHHLILEFCGCPYERLTHVEDVHNAMHEAALAGNCSIVGDYYHQFKPHGASGATVIEESHLTVHTWPEHGYAAVDFFYCGGNVDSEAVIEVLKHRFEPTDVSVTELTRGPLAPHAALPA